MPHYRYAGLAEDGRKVKGVIEAPSLTSARFEVLSRRIEPSKIEEKKHLGQFEITKRKVRPDELMLLCRQLAAFVRSGIPIIDGLETIAAEQKKGILPQVLLEVADGLRGGDTLSGALEQHAAAFPVYFVPMIRAAELSGTIDVVLDRIGGYLERSVETRRAVRSALTYPLIVLCLAVFTVAVLVGWVLPRYERFFEQLDAKLPATTRFLLALSGFVGDWWMVLGGGLVGAAVLLVVFLRSRSGQRFRSRVVLRLPLAGDMVRYAVVERCFRILSAMVRSGVTLPTALPVTADTAQNAVFRDALIDARDEMMQGAGLTEPIAATGLFPPAALQMLRVGETTGTIDAQLETAADFYEQELRHRVQKLTTIFEPALIVVLGAVVGFVALALVQAMYGVFQNTNLK